MSKPPDREPVVRDDRLVTRPWLAFFQDILSGAAITIINLATQVTGRLTYANLPLLDASRLLGRGSAAGTGDVQPITLGPGLAMVGTELQATATSGAYVPVSTGAEPLEILSDGAGAVLLVPYTP